MGSWRAERQDRSKAARVPFAAVMIGAFAEDLKRASTEHYGTAGPAFLKVLTNAYASEEAFPAA